MWENSVVTNSGKALLALWVTGTMFNLDSAKGGTDTVLAVNLRNQTGLVNEKQTLSLLGYEAVADGIKVKIRVLAHPTAGYTLNQFGIWGSIDGGATTLVVLYQDAIGFPIPSVADNPDFAYTFYAIIQMANDGSLSITIDPSALLTMDDLLEGLASKQAAIDTETLAREEADAAINNLINSGVTLTPSIGVGMNSVIRKSDGVTSIPKFTMQGKSYVNLLGKDGNCEDVNKWTQNTSTATLDNTNKVFGTNSIKMTINSTSGNIYKTGLFDSTKYYFASAYLKNGDATQVVLDKTTSGGGSYVSYAVTDTTKFVRAGIKIQPSQINESNALRIYASGSSGQYAYIDGVMLIEITADEYNNLTIDQLLERYPYVDSYACLENPYIEVRHDNLVRNGNGEEGVGWWNAYFGSPTISIENGKFKLVTTTAWHGYSQKINVKPNTSYYVSANLSGLGFISIYDTTYTTNLRDGVGTFNSGNRTQIAVIISNSGVGTGYYDSIMLVEGTTALTEYKPCRIERCMIEGKFTSDDSFTFENGEVSGLLSWKHRTLYGKDIDGWLLSGDLIGAKRVYVPNYYNGIKALGEDTGYMIKYDGKILTQTLSVASTSSADMFHNNNLDLLFSISDSDSGWAETIAPNADEVKAFMNGWKATANNGTRYTSWVSVVDGTTVPTGQNIDYVKANVAQNYIGYQLHYRLATPEPITDANVHVHGDIPKLDNGDNYLYVDYGMVIGEVANPKSDGANYTINTYTASVDTRLKNKAELLNTIYKNQTWNNEVWTIEKNLVTGYGYYKAYTAPANYDPNATYTVDYTILRTLYTSPTVIAMQYQQDVLSAVSELAEAVNSRQKADSALDNLVDMSVYEYCSGMQISPVIATKTTSFNSVASLSAFIQFSGLKKTMPVVTISISSISVKNDSGATVDVPISDTTNVLGLPYKSGFIVVIYLKSGTNATYALNNGGWFNFSWSADCRGRL